MKLSEYTAEVIRLALEAERHDDVEQVRWLIGDDVEIAEANDTGLTPQEYIDEQYEALT